MAEDMPTVLELMSFVLTSIECARQKRHLFVYILLRHPQVMRMRIVPGA